MTFPVPLERLRLRKSCLRKKNPKEERDRIPGSPGAVTVRSFYLSTNSPANLLKTNPGARRLRSSSDPSGPCIPEFPERSGSPHARHARPPTGYRRDVDVPGAIGTVAAPKILSTKKESKRRKRSYTRLPGAVTVRSFSLSTNSPANLLKTNPGAESLPDFPASPVSTADFLPH